MQARLRERIYPVPSKPDRKPVSICLEHMHYRVHEEFRRKRGRTGHFFNHSMRLINIKVSFDWKLLFSLQKPLPLRAASLFICTLPSGRQYDSPIPRDRRCVLAVRGCLGSCTSPERLMIVRGQNMGKLGRHSSGFNTHSRPLARVRHHVIPPVIRENDFAVLVVPGWCVAFADSAFPSAFVFPQTFLRRGTVVRETVCGDRPCRNHTYNTRRRRLGGVE